MRKQGVLIDDYYELLALHKALLEAKFNESPENMMIAGSPYIAKICRDVVREIIAIELEKNNLAKETWDTWLKIKNHQQYRKKAINHSKKNEIWQKFTKDKKVEYTKNLLSPFVCDDLDIEKFIKEVDDEYNC